MAAAQTPQPPYYAVIFTSTRTAPERDDGYAATAARMQALAAEQPGYLGFETARADLGITVSYWTDLAAIQNWKAQAEHQQAQQHGREKWYANYCVRIAKVEREYSFGGDR